MKTPIAILILILTFICGTAGERTDVARYVNPLIGTDFTGNTYPGAQVPFGMVQLSPDNGLSGWDRIAGYFYPDSTIAGFSHTHLSGTGAGDLYDISFMPVTLDRTPDFIRDRFDLRTFDEGLRRCDTLSVVFRQPTEELLFVPPHGVPHGTSHFILYHNDEPFVHFSCNRNVRFGPLRMEYLTPDSLYWHLLDNETLRSYGCRAIKGKLLRYLTQPDLPTPEYLALGNDYGFWLSCILEDLYVGMPRRSPEATQDFEGFVNSQTEPCVFVVSNWENWPEERLAEWIACMERHARGGSHRWVFSGKSREVKALLAKHASLSRLIPAEHRWYTDPLTKMERLYVAIDNDSNGDLLPSFTRYESLYTQIVTPTSR